MECKETLAASLTSGLVAMNAPLSCYGPDLKHLHLFGDTSSAATSRHKYQIFIARVDSFPQRYAMLRRMPLQV